MKCMAQNKTAKALVETFFIYTRGGHKKSKSEEEWTGTGTFSPSDSWQLEKLEVITGRVDGLGGNEP